MAGPRRGYFEPDPADVRGIQHQAAISSPASATDPLDLCMQAYSAADAWTRQDSRTRWVMDLAWYKRIRAAGEASSGRCTDPATWTPDPGDMLFGIRISVRPGGGAPHLEAPARPAWCSEAADARDAAMELAREVLAPPPLDQLAGDVMLAVASVPGKIPEEWRAAGFLHMAWPHAADAWVHAMEMTAGQLRDRLAERDASA